VRLLVVLGYSRRRGKGLHPICAARVARAAEVARTGDVVVLSGTAPEVRLMQGAWPPPLEVVTDAAARRTADTAVSAASLVDTLGVDEIVLVTSWWHAPRTRLLVLLALGRGAPPVMTARAGGPWTPAQLLREIACFLLVPIQLWLARARRSEPLAS
jgi:uncharacterized SAM-binding protein YcdF (DUF218 family)